MAMHAAWAELSVEQADGSAKLHHVLAANGARQHHARRARPWRAAVVGTSRWAAARSNAQQRAARAVHWLTNWLKASAAEVLTTVVHMPTSAGCCFAALL